MILTEKNIFISNINTNGVELNLIFNSIVEEVNIFGKKCFKYNSNLEFIGNSISAIIDFKKLNSFIDILNNVIVNINKEAQNIVNGSINISSFNSSLIVEDKHIFVNLDYNNQERKIYVSLCLENNLLINQMPWNNFKTFVSDLSIISNNWYQYQFANINFFDLEIEKVEKPSNKLPDCSIVPFSTNVSTESTIEVEKEEITDNSTINYNSNNTNDFFNSLEGYEHDILNIEMDDANIDDNTQNINNNVDQNNPKKELIDPLDLF